MANEDRASQLASRPWREVVRDIEPSAADAIEALTASILTDPTAIPRRYKELILVATSSTIRYRGSMERHARAALDQGATRREVFEAMALASLTGGLTCLIEGCDVLDRVAPGAD